MVDMAALTEPLTCCPCCEGGLLEQDRPQVRTRPGRPQDRANSLDPVPRTVEVRVMVPTVRCDAEEPCSWYIQGGGNPIGARLPSLLEECANGHRRSWANPQQRFGRIGVHCLGFLRGLMPCPERASTGGRGQGFLSPGYLAPDLPFLAKLPVLLALAQAGEHGESLGGLVGRLPGLTRGQIEGQLGNGLKFGYLERSSGKVKLVPRGSGFVYFLSTRGQAWLNWAKGEWWYYPIVGGEHEKA